MKNSFSEIRNFLLDTLFPKNCLGCNAEGSYICAPCLEKIQPNKQPKCPLCGKRSPEHATCYSCKNKTRLSGIIVANNWEDALLKQLIYEYKYRFIKEISKELSKTLIKSLSNHNIRLINIDNIIISFVPLHPRRESWRGFNQSELLANKISKHLGWKTATLLKKTKNTAPQAEIETQSARIKNAKNAFSLISPPILPVQGKILLIVDDVCTTGATLEQCAKTLKPLKPKEIWGIVLARG